MNDWIIDKILRTENRYSKKEWEDYFEYFRYWGLTEKYNEDYRLVGIGCYYFTNTIKYLDVLPFNPWDGKYLCISKVVIKDGFEKKNIPTIMLLRVLKKYPNIKTVFWNNAKHNDQLSLFKIRGVKNEPQKAQCSVV